MERPAGSLGRALDMLFWSSGFWIGAWRIQTFLLRHLIGPMAVTKLDSNQSESVSLGLQVSISLRWSQFFSWLFWIIEAISRVLRHVEVIFWISEILWRLWFKVFYWLLLWKWTKSKWRIRFSSIDSHLTAVLETACRVCARARNFKPIAPCACSRGHARLFNWREEATRPSAQRLHNKATFWLDNWNL